MTTVDATTGVATTDGRAEMARLAAHEPVPRLERVLLPREAYRAEPGGHVAPDDLVQSAERLGFRFLGRFWFAGMFGRPRREMWVDRTSVVRLSMRAASGGPIASAMSAYFLSTTFDDGSAIVTWSKTLPAVPSRPRALSLAGTGSLAIDYANHLAVTRERCVGRVALTVPDLETGLAMSFWFDTRLVPAGGVRAATYLNIAACAALAVASAFGRSHRVWAFLVLVIAAGLMGLGGLLRWASRAGARHDGTARR